MNVDHSNPYPEGSFKWWAKEIIIGTIAILVVFLIVWTID